MAIVICDTGDVAALWAIGELQARGVPITLVTAPAIEHAQRWTHRVGTVMQSELLMADGTLLASATAEPILNRLSYAPTTHLARIAGADYEYAAQEMHALLLSFLHAWPGVVVNRPTPQGLAGYVCHPSHWLARARTAGLPIRPWRQTDATDPDVAWQSQGPALTAFVVGNEVIAPGLPDSFADPCRRLAQAVDALLLGIDFACGETGWAAVCATPQPYLPHGGSALAGLLRGHA
jgi:hypothetical protein